jgi:hypothetical protein
MDWATADANLWIVVASPNPDSNPAGASAKYIVVGCRDGKSRVIPPESVQTELTKQNRLRKQHGLPPLPLPRTITHDSPAVSQSD